MTAGPTGIERAVIGFARTACYLPAINRNPGSSRDDVTYPEATSANHSRRRDQARSAARQRARVRRSRSRTSAWRALVSVSWP